MKKLIFYLVFAFALLAVKPLAPAQTLYITGLRQWVPWKTMSGYKRYENWEQISIK